MNYDLIIKLAKLANENPNENEANLAARKVCQLIKSSDYKFNNSVPTPPPRPPTKPTTYGDIRRSPESFWNSRPSNNSYRGRTRPNPYTSHHDAWNDIINDFINSGGWRGFGNNPEREKDQEIAAQCSKCGLQIIRLKSDKQPYYCFMCTPRENKI